MFSPQIVDSDAFLDMPQTSQLLYFHLAMRADDDGFVGNPRRLLRLIGGNEDDLKVLIAKRFILTFESGVVVIKHWRIHNLIRHDRYNETKYLDEKNSLIIKENGSYTELPTTRQPDGNQLAPQVRLGKVRLGKVSDTLVRACSDDALYADPLFQEFWNLYPKKTGKGATWLAWKKTKPTERPAIPASISKHVASPQWKREDGRFIPNPATFLNQRRWEDEPEIATITTKRSSY